MNEETKKKKSTLPHPDRVTLNSETLVRLREWAGQLAPQLKGYRVTRSDLVNWLVARHTSELSQAETKELEQKFFDPVKALEWTLSQLKGARARGEEIDVGKMIGENVLVGPKQAGG